MLEKKQYKNEIDNKIIKNFFDIWILKEFINDCRFEKYYLTFLDENNNFNDNLLKLKLDEIFELISKFWVTTDNPNTLSTFSEEKIKYILEKDIDNYSYGWAFSDEINIQILWWEIEMKDEWIIKNSFKRDEKIEKVKDWLKSYLNWLYNNWVYNIWTSETINDVVKKIIEILRK